LFQVSSAFFTIFIFAINQSLQVFLKMANPTPTQSSKQGFLERGISGRSAVAILLAVVIIAVVIIAIPRLQEQMSPEPSPQFTIVSKSDWWTEDEIPDGIGGDSVLHVKVVVKNYGEAAGVCLVNVKVEEPGGRSWQRFRFVSISPGDTVEEQVDFPEVVDKNVEYTAWLTYP